MNVRRVHLVTDDDVLRDASFHAHAAAVLDRCGADIALHVRGHGCGGGELYHIAAPLAEHALRTGAWLIVNDRIDIAMAVRANGVQLGVRSIPVRDARALIGAGARIGWSAHDVATAARGAAEGAAWVVAGTIYASASHADEQPAGPALLTECVRHVDVPVIAIGGMTPARVAEVARAGAHGVAVLSGVWRAGDPAAAAAQYIDAARAAWQYEEGT